VLTEGKNSGETDTVRGYRAESNKSLTKATLSVIGVGVKLAVCLKGAKVSYVVNEKA